MGVSIPRKIYIIYIFILLVVGQIKKTIIVTTAVFFVLELLYVLLVFSEPREGENHRQPKQDRVVATQYNAQR